MSKNFAIISHMKIKNESMHDGVSAEAHRSIAGDNVDRSRTHKNIIINKSPYSNYAHFVKEKKEELNKANVLIKIWNNQNPDNKRKLRRFPRQTMNKKTNKKQQSALSQQFVFTHSPSALTEEKSIEYLNAADKFIKNWFSGNEIISSIIHLDETTPHIHIDIAYFDVNDKKFNQKILSKAGKTDINKIRSAFQKEVADEFDLIKQDGSVVDPNKHEWRADLVRAEEKKALTESAKELAEVKYDLSKTNNQLYVSNYAKDLNSKMLKDLEEQKNTIINEKNAQMAELKKVITQRDIKITTLEQNQQGSVEKIVEKVVRDNDDITKISQLETTIRENKKEKSSLEVAHTRSVEKFNNLYDRYWLLKTVKEALDLEIGLLPTHDEINKERELKETLKEKNIKLKNEKIELNELLKTANLQIKDLKDKLKDSSLQLAEALKQKEISRPDITIPSVLDDEPKIDLGTTPGEVNIKSNI